MGAYTNEKRVFDFFILHCFVFGVEKFNPKVSPV